MKIDLKYYWSLILLLLTACATTPHTEADQYQQLKSSTVYKAYQKLTIKSLKPIVREYDQYLVKENKPRVAATQVHAMLGLVWIASAQPKFALVESEYAIAQANDPGDRYAALTIQALAMHQKGWPYLAKSRSIEAKALIKKHGLSNRYHNGLAIVYIGGSMLALQEGNILYVADEISALGQATNQSWLVGLGEVVADSYTGATKKAFSRLESIKNNSNLSAKDRRGVEKVLNVLTAGGKDVATSVAKEVVAVGLNNVIKNSSLTSKILKKLPEKYRAKL